MCFSKNNCIFHLASCYHVDCLSVSGLSEIFLNFHDKISSVSSVH